MNNKTFSKIRVAFIIQGCPRCRLICEFIERINAKLPVYKRIQVIDCTYYNNYKITENYLINLYGKHFDGFPTLFIGNKKISGANTRIESEAFLSSLLEEEYDIPEYSDKKFNKKCEFKKGIFGRKIICN